jgi:hypothetical protein
MDRENQVNTNIVDRTEEQVEKDQDVRDELDLLFEDAEAEKFRTHWMNIQSKFVDNPRESVREADELVADVLKSITMSFHSRRTSLEKQWNNGTNVSTEDLRVTLQRYRSFFDRLLTLES